MFSPDQLIRQVRMIGVRLWWTSFCVRAMWRAHRTAYRCRQALFVSTTRWWWLRWALVALNAAPAYRVAGCAACAACAGASHSERVTVRAASAAKIVCRTENTTAPDFLEVRA